MRGPELEIDLSAIAANWRALDGIGPAETAAVIKADAYGCLARAVAPHLESVGCRTFFTASLEEATRVAQFLGRGAVIYVFNGLTGAEDWPEDSRIRPVLHSLSQVRRWSAMRRQTPVGLQIETGMNRLGASKEECAALIAENILKSVDVSLLMTHLARADGQEDPLLAAQKSAFDAALTLLKPAFPQALASLSATGGAILGPDYGYDLIRPGIGLYGGSPFAAARSVVKVSAPLMRVWPVQPGERSGYDGAWVAERPSLLATAPVGYADGFRRSLESRWKVRLPQGTAPLAGRVSMDLIVLDVTDLDPAPKPGDRALFLDDEFTIDVMAQATGTIGYEILTGLNAARRLKRRLNSV